MHNITDIVSSGRCIGCAACCLCGHIRFINGPNGFPVPTVDMDCSGCRKCLDACLESSDD